MYTEMYMKAYATNPLVWELIRGAVFLGGQAVPPSWPGREIKIDEEVVRKALERAIKITRDEKLLATRNDVRNPSGPRGPLARLTLECFNAEPPATLDKFLDFALKSLHRLEGCGEEHAPKLSIMNAELDGQTGEDDTPADALTVALAYAGLAWNLGLIRLSSPRDLRYFLFIPISLSSLADEVVLFLAKARKERGKFLPDYANDDRALSLWMAVNFGINGVFKVIYLKKVLSKFVAHTAMTVDLPAERSAVERVFEKPLEEVKQYLNGVLRNALSDSPDPLATKFVDTLYQVAHNIAQPEELKLLGLRDYAFLLTNKSEIPPIVRDVAKTALAVKL